jgi:parallel beta-helix repeat protein
MGPWDGTLEHPCQNISSGLAYATAGDTVFVFNGTYNEALNITRPVILRGQDRHGTVIDGNQTGNVIRITADFVTVSGFTVQNSGLGSDSSGISISGSHHGNISFNIIKGNRNGIRLYDSSNNTFTENTVSSNYYGIALSGSSGNAVIGNSVSASTDTGIQVSDSADVTIANNNVSQGNFGITFIAVSNSTLINNDISANRYGAYLFVSSNDILSNNHIHDDTDFGIWISQSDHTSAANNKISNERIGIYVNNSTFNTITNSSISSCQQFGIRLDYSDNNTIAGNTLFENVVRGTLCFYSNNNTILHNNFVNNTKALADINSTSLLDNGIEGNYWSDYNGTDSDQDGIGNSPYAVDTNNTDHYPLMAPFSDLTITFEEETYHLFIVCNCTISQFRFDETLRMLQYNVTGPSNTTGFCRILIPELLVNKPYTVLVDETPTNTTVVPPSNTTHTCLYFAYNLNAAEIKIVAKPYYDLFTAYNTILGNYQTLNATYYQVLADYFSLNTTYQQKLADYDFLNQTYSQLVANYTELDLKYQQLSANYGNLTKTYLESARILNETISNYTRLELEYNMLNQTFQQTQANYTRLLADHDTLNQAYEVLLASSTNTRTALLVLLTAAIAIVAAMSTLTLKYHSKLGEQRKLIEKYKSELERISLLDIARTLFEADVQRRHAKIEKFGQKYGISVKPRDTLEDVIANLELKKKEEESK